MNLVEDIRVYVQEELLYDTDETIELDENLLLTGILDSLALMRLIAHFEDWHDIEIPAQDITLENFGTLQTMSAYLDNRLVAISDDRRRNQA